MKVKAYLSGGLFLIFLLAFLPLSHAAPPGVVGHGQGDYLDTSKQTWKEYSPPIRDPLGHPKWPWLPKDPYPFTQPYTGTELAYLSNTDHRTYGAKYSDYALNSARLNKRGLLTQRKGYIKRELFYDHYSDIMDYNDGKIKIGGEITNRLIIYETPADVRGTQSIKNHHLNSPITPWLMADSWSYSPGLRRVTRSQGGDRQDEILGTPVTNDDEGDREVWEEEQELIGEDVLYMQMVDPQFLAMDRRANTGDLKVDGEWFVKNADPTRGELKLNPYRPDGGVECFVVKNTWAKRREGFGSHVYPDPKQYYLKYRLVWIEKVTKAYIRDEQYDHDNRLIKVYRINPEFFAGGVIEGGLNRTQYMQYDYRRHFRSWGSYDRADMGPKFKAPRDWFSPEHMFREYFWRKLKIPLLKDMKEFAPPPELWRAKFPKYRKGTSDWLVNSKEDIDYMNSIWREHGYTDEEIDALQNGDGMVRKGGKMIPVRRSFRPSHIHGKPLPVKFPTG
ncbi:MAG: outer membrane lipoprotein-sorting protein [Nitrospinae bacterium]|nr:outer membrane lipoprotein-sorting protein [Nitrospinota bacterium]